MTAPRAMCILIPHSARLTAGAAAVRVGIDRREQSKAVLGRCRHDLRRCSMELPQWASRYMIP
jgi:hypothetical protein